MAIGSGKQGQVIQLPQNEMNRKFFITRIRRKIDQNLQHTININLELFLLFRKHTSLGYQDNRYHGNASQDLRKCQKYAISRKPNDAKAYVIHRMVWCQTAVQNARVFIEFLRFLPLDEPVAERYLLSYPDRIGGRVGGRTGGNAFGAS